MTNRRPLATIPQAIAHTGSCRSSFYKLFVRSGLVPLVKIGRSSRIDLDDLDRAIESMKASHVQDA